MSTIDGIAVPATILLEGSFVLGTCGLDEGRTFELPSDYEGMRNEWLRKIHESGKNPVDGPGCGLLDWEVSCDAQRGTRLHLAFGLASYYSICMHEMHTDLLATHALAALRSNALERSGLPFRPQLACSLLTSDNLLVVTLRGDHLAVASGVFHASIVGGMDPGQDFADPSVPAPVAAMKREAGEELGVDPQSVHFRYFFADMERNAQPGLAGVAVTNLTAQELLTQYPRDRKEGLRLCVAPNMDAVKYIVNMSRMPAVGKLALIAGVREAARTRAHAHA